MSRTVLVGFDSAWTDQPRNPGGFCALELRPDAPPAFHPPRLARFDEAEQRIRALAADATLLLVAIDQPTVVPNRTGARPVDRIAARVLSRIKGGVQPAFRDGARASMFGDDAPIWRFLRALALEQDPERSRTAASGRFAIEVFPALALPTLVPAFLERNRAAKYNPAVGRQFALADWRLVCEGLADRAASLGLTALSDWAREQAPVPKPTKGDQDRLDAALCLLVAAHWRLAPAEDSMVIGDVATGYVVTPASVPIRAILEAPERAKRPRTVLPRPRTPVPPTKTGDRIDSIQEQERRMRADPPNGRLARMRPIDPAELRALLVGIARARRVTSYGAVAAALDYPFHQGFVSLLLTAFRGLSAENRRRNEPQLMCLVVSKASGKPGGGFFATMRSTGLDGDQTVLFEAERNRCWSHAWTDDKPAP